MESHPGGICVFFGGTVDLKDQLPREVKIFQSSGGGAFLDCAF